MITSKINIVGKTLSLSSQNLIEKKGPCEPKRLRKSQKKTPFGVFLIIIIYHVVPQLLHLWVLPILLLAKPKIPVDIIRLTVPILEILVLPQLGQ